MMSNRLVILLCFLILHHEVIIAKQHASHVRDFSRVKSLKKHHSTHDKKDKENGHVIYDSRGPIYIGHDLATLYGDDEIEDLSTDDVLYSRSLVFSTHHNFTKSIQKTEGGKRRLFGLILLLVSLVTTFASIGVDTYVSIKGCAGLYPSLKTFEDQFEVKKRELEVTANEIDNLQMKAQKMKKAIEDSSDVMERIWEEVERISRHQEDILKALDPEILVAMNNASAKIAGRIRATQGEAEELSYEKIDAEFQGIFSSATTVVATFGPALVSVLAPIAQASFKYYKISKIATTVKAADAAKILQAAPKAQKLLGFTDDIVKANLKATGALRFASRGSGTLKALKFLKGAGAVLSIVGIGVDIFSIVSTVLECRDKRDRAKESLDKLKEAEKEAIGADKELKEFWDEICQFWKDNVCKNVRGKALKEAVKNIQKLVKIAMKQTPDSVQTSNQLQQFLDQIDTAKPIATVKLLTDLLTSVASVEYSMKCYKNKFSLLGHVVNQCKAGTAPYDTLYQEAQQLFAAGNDECRTKSGVEYTTQQEVRSIVGRAAELLKFNIECPLNRAEIKDQACSLKRDGYSDNEISSRLKVIVSAVKTILQTCSHSLTPAQKKAICRLKENADLTNKQIADSLQIDEKEVNKVTCSK